MKYILYLISIFHNYHACPEEKRKLEINFGNSSKESWVVRRYPISFSIRNVDP